MFDFFIGVLQDFDVVFIWVLDRKLGVFDKLFELRFTDKVQ